MRSEGRFAYINYEENRNIISRKNYMIVTTLASNIVFFFRLYFQFFSKEMNYRISFK